MAVALVGVTGDEITGSSGTVTTHTGTKVGHVLVAFHSNDGGSIQAPIGGGSWQPLESLSGSLTTRAWWAVASSAGAVPVTFRQSFGAEGEAAIAVYSGALAATPLHNGLAAFEGDNTIATPSISFPIRGQELRWAAGFALAEAGVVISPPAGFTTRYAHQGGIFTTVCLATRTGNVGSAGVQTFTASYPELLGSHGITVGILPDTTSGGGGELPPVTFPAFAPGRGTSLYRYSFRRVKDGVFLGDLDLEGVRFDKRINQAGTFSARMPITNAGLAEAVDAIVPQDPSELDRGPGAIVVDIWRDTDLWGEYWITAADLSQDGRANPVLDLQGVTLDAYLLQVEIQEDLEYDADEIEIARALILHAQEQPHANIALQPMSGNSGNPRERTYEAAKPITYGQAIAELAKIGDGFEHMVNLTVEGGVITRRWVWGAPRLGQEAEHVFTQPGDVTHWRERRDALRGGTRFRVRGGTIQTDATQAASPEMSETVDATAHLEAGHLRIDRTIDHPMAATDQTTLDAYAAWWAGRNAGAVLVHEAQVILGAEPTLTPNRLGDYARLVLTNPWHRRVGGRAGYDKSLRVIGVEITPTSRAAGRERCRLIFEEEL